MAHNLTLRKVFDPLKSRLIQKSISEAYIQLPERGLPELVTVNELRHRGLGLEHSQTSFENELPSTSFSASHPRRTLEGSAEVFSTLNLRGNMGPTKSNSSFPQALVLASGGQTRGSEDTGVCGCHHRCLPSGKTISGGPPMPELIRVVSDPAAAPVQTTESEGLGVCSARLTSVFKARKY